MGTTQRLEVWGSHVGAMDLNDFQLQEPELVEALARSRPRFQDQPTMPPRRLCSQWLAPRTLRGIRSASNRSPLWEYVSGIRQPTPGASRRYYLRCVLQYETVKREWMSRFLSDPAV